jgi:hypothetical protein
VGIRDTIYAIRMTLPVYGDEPVIPLLPRPGDARR